MDFDDTVASCVVDVAMYLPGLPEVFASAFVDVLKLLWVGFVLEGAVFEQTSFRVLQLQVEHFGLLVDALVQEQGEDAPVAVFVYTAADVADATTRSAIRNDSHRVDPAQVLLELQTNAVDPPLEDQILEVLEELVQEQLNGEA